MPPSSDGRKVEMKETGYHLDFLEGREKNQDSQ